MKIFKSTATREEILTENGEYPLTSLVVNSRITEEMNSNYVLEASVGISRNVFNSDVYDLIREESVIVVEDESGEQPFVINQVRKTKTRIDIMCRHLVIDRLTRLFLKDCRPEGIVGQGALSKMLNDATGRFKDFFIISNISNKSTAYYQNKNMYDALFNEDNSFVNRWGGETKFDGFNCYINTRVGNDTDVVIQSKKNLIGFEIESNNEELCTQIVPKGYDGIEANIVNSKNINNYASIYTKVMKFEDVKVKDENNPDEGFDTLELAQQELNRRANEQFDLFNVDKILATYRIDFIELSRTEQYKDFEIAERVLIGDTVTVKEDIYNTEIKARVVKRVYSPSLRRRIETVISNIQQSYKPISIESIIEELENMKDVGQNGSLSDYVNAVINAGMKDSYVVLKPNELLIMDDKDINKAKNVTRYNKNGLGFSRNGYYGKYEYGFTIDGKMNASLITTGILSATVIAAKSITADKLEITGATTLGDKNGHYMQIENACLTVNQGNMSNAFLGYRIMNNGFDKYVVPKLAMGAYGYGDDANYFAIISYRGGKDNPQQTQAAYVDIAYHCLTNKEFSNIKMYDGGDIRIAPVRNFEVTTNFIKGEQGDGYEKRIALFGSENSNVFDGYMAIGCVRNKDNGNGLLLCDDRDSDSNKWTRVRVNTDSAGVKYFRPVTNSGDVSCGSGGFPWKSVVSKTNYITDNIISEKAVAKTTSDILDNIDFVQSSTREGKIKIDVSAIKGSVYAPVLEEVQTIDTTELLKLALMEIKKLKGEIALLKASL